MQISDSPFYIIKKERENNYPTPALNLFLEEKKKTNHHSHECLHYMHGSAAQHQRSRSAGCDVKDYITVLILCNGNEQMTHDRTSSSPPDPTTLNLTHSLHYWGCPT